MATTNPILLRAQRQRAWLKRRGTPRHRYTAHKANARRRGIPFLLTFEEWWSIWQASGHWEECGKGSRYMMARFGDQGGYEVGNVSIIPGPQNSRDNALRIEFWTHSKPLDDVPLDHKRCPDCKLILPMLAFCVDRSRPIGVKSYCRNCASRRHKEWRSRYAA